jgi:hypothetical protein
LNTENRFKIKEQKINEKEREIEITLEDISDERETELK